MNNKCLISIIVPVYNVKKYLPKCMSSILKHHKFTDYEVILIDDGSTDGSEEMCDNYAKKYNRVKVVHKENGGASQARNEGMRHAVGKYILFIDSDDYIAKASVEKIAATIIDEGETDVIFLSAVSVLPDGSKKHRQRHKKNHFYHQSQMNVLQNIAGSLPDCVWDKLIKREVILQNNIFFTEGIICEDVDFTMKLYINAKTYNVFDFNYYYYRDGRNGSVMNTHSDRLFTDLLFIIQKWVGLAKTVHKEYASIIYSWVLQSYCWVLIPRYTSLPRNVKKLSKKNVDNLRWLFNHSNDKKIGIIRNCYKLFGLNLVSGMISFYYKVSNTLFN